MISTVTTSTVTTLANVSLAGTLGLIAIVFLLLLLVQKEISTTGESKKMERWSRALNVAIPSLLIVFVSIVFVRIALVLH
jgi:cytochrome c biogenesis protein CcdA